MLDPKCPELVNSINIKESFLNYKHKHMFDPKWT